MYKLILDRMVGNHKLHKNVAIVAAGNKETDNAIVHPVSTAIQSRMVHLELVPDAREWVDWASQNNVDHRITSYINFKPNMIYTFDPNHTDKTYACPRTWKFTDKLLKEVDISSSLLLPMLAGTISEGVAREFIAFCKTHESLPKIDAIVRDPDNIKMPSEPSILYALTGALGHHTTDANMGDVMRFVVRMPLEFQVICLRELIRRNEKAINHSAIQSWISNNAAELF